MLPVSICLHVAAALAVLIVPLAADDEWPTPAPLHSPAVITKTVAVPPSELPRRPARRVDNAVAVTVPSQIEPERERVEDSAGTGPIGTPDLGPSVSTNGFLPSGVGTQVAIVEPPPPPVAPPALYRVGQGVREPRKVVDVAPIYPEIARNARVDGVVILEAVINTDGRVERVKVLRSVPLLDAAAVAAVKEWRYTPTLLNGAPVSVLLTITINFTLRN
jgi:protein TonB